MALLKDLPKVKLRGEEYQLKGFSYADIYEIVDSVEVINKRLEDDFGDKFNLMNVTKLGKAQQMKILFKAVKHSKEEIDKILSIALGVEKEELSDSDRFPPSTPIKVGKKLWNDHGDIQEFKDEIKNAFNLTGLEKKVKENYEKNLQEMNKKA